MSAGVLKRRLPDRPLYHFACFDHAAAGIDRDGVLKPELAPTGLVWLTDLDVPDRNALGLTRRFSACDRTQVRYTVSEAKDVFAWSDYRRHVAQDVRAVLEVPGTMLMHWWVSPNPVRVSTPGLVRF